MYIIISMILFSSIWVAFVCSLLSALFEGVMPMEMYSSVGSLFEIYHLGRDVFRSWKIKEKLTKFYEQLLFHFFHEVIRLTSQNQIFFHWFEGMPPLPTPEYWYDRQTDPSLYSSAMLLYIFNIFIPWIQRQ